MWALEPTTTNRLGSLVNAMTRDPFLREDLMQEALCHFWNMERTRPGQTVSWYLQSCSFHLRHCLASGRSVDSSKRRGLQIELPEEEDPWDLLEGPAVEIPVLAQVETREIIDLLSRYLAPREQAILECLRQGLGPREIGRRLKLSHPTVIKCRRKMAALAIRLGIGRGSEGRVWPARPPSNGSARAKPISWLAQSTNGNGLNGHNHRDHRNGDQPLRGVLSEGAVPQARQQLQASP